MRGNIPKGNYGAGIVEIWDEGTYNDIDNSSKDCSKKIFVPALKSGDLKFQLFGKKLKGEFALVKLKSKEDNSWLLIKHSDKYAVDTEYNSEEQTPKNSPINKWLAENKKDREKKKFVQTSIAGDRKLTQFIKPMLAKETDKPFDDKNWVFEIKWDGYRAITEKTKNKILLYSRNGLSFLSTYPIVADQLSSIKEDVVIRR